MEMTTRLRRAYNMQPRRNTPVRQKLTVVARIILIAGAILALFTFPTQAKDQDGWFTSMCSNPIIISRSNTPGPDSMFALESYTDKKTPDGIIGAYPSVSGYVGEFKGSNFFGIIDDDTSYFKQYNVDGTEKGDRPNWGADDDTDDWRINVLGGEGRSCFNFGVSAHVGVINFFLTLSGFAWLLSNWLFQTVLNSTFVHDLTSMIESVITALKNTFFLDYVVVAIIVVGVWVAFQALRGGVLKILGGLGWMTGVLCLGFLVLGSPGAIVDEGEEITSLVQNSIISSVMSASPSGDLCEAGGNVTNVSEPTDLATTVSCSTWQALLYEPTVLLQWGKPSGDMDTINGTPAPSGPQTNNISNWGFYNIWSQIKQSDSEPDVVTQGKFFVVVDQLAAPGMDHSLYPAWSKLQFGDIWSDMAVALVFAIAGIALGWSLGVVCVEMVIYSIMMAIYLLFLPFALIVGVHPTVGRPIMKRWFGGFMGSFLHRIILSLYLAVMMLFLMFVVVFIGGDSGASVLTGVIFLIITLILFKKMKTILSSFVGSHMGGGENVLNSSGRMRQLLRHRPGHRAAVTGAAALSAGIAGHKIARANRGGGKLGALIRGRGHDTRFKDSEAGKLASKNLNKKIGTLTGDQLWKGQTFDRKRRSGESDANYQERMRQLDQVEQEAQDSQGQTRAEREVNNYGLNPKDYADQGSFNRAVDERRKAHERLESGYFDRNLKREWGAVVRGEKHTANKAAMSAAFLNATSRFSRYQSVWRAGSQASYRSKSAMSQFGSSYQRGHLAKAGYSSDPRSGDDSSWTLEQRRRSIEEKLRRRDNNAARSAARSNYNQARNKEVSDTILPALKDKYRHGFRSGSKYAPGIDKDGLEDFAKKHGTSVNSLTPKQKEAFLRKMANKQYESAHPFTFSGTPKKNYANPTPSSSSPFKFS